jgi:hypothetical protein
MELVKHISEHEALGFPTEDTDISGLVPYSGATADVDLATHNLTTQTVYRYQLFTYFN